MGRAKETTAIETDQPPAELVLGKATKLVLFALALLVFLALISFDPADSESLANGAPYEINNWIGHVGAHLSGRLLLVFGFAIYPAVMLFLLSFLRRLFFPAGTRATRWEYWLSFLFLAVGGAMLLGVWPDLWEDAAVGLNLTSMPGGALGQRLSAPETGWVRLIMHPTGSVIVSSVLILFGLLVLWIYDWNGLIIAAYHRLKARMNELEEDTAKTDIRSRAERLAAAKKRQAEKDAGKAEKERRKNERRRKETAPPAAEPRKPLSVVQDLGLPETSEPVDPVVKKPRAAAAAKADYILPGVNLLQEWTEGSSVTQEEIDHRKSVLQETLDSFGIDAAVGEATSGPRVTLFEVETAPGVKVERVSRIANNIAMEMEAMSLRILTPIPGKKTVGIEVPNGTASTVPLRSVLESPVWKKTKASIPLVIGKSISGKMVLLDLARAPHLLIAGATGSGKSVCINAMIMSLLYKFTPDELRLILVDPKVVEFSGYNTLPHLVTPVITESKKVPLALRWVITEMEKRYRICAKVGARNIATFNARPPADEPVYDDNGDLIPEKMPYIVVIIDELADIMMTAKSEVETSLARIAQLSRAVGIHTIVATQRPSVNVITGVIKANYPTRIAFQVTSQVDSRTILDGKGAEKLLGRGDMLFRPPGASNLERNQSPLVEDEEIEGIVKFCSVQAQQQFDETVFKGGDAGTEADVPGGGDLSDADEELIDRAIEVIMRDRRATTSYVQRALRIGYNRSALIMEILEQRGVVGPQIGSAPREILINDNNGDDLRDSTPPEADETADGEDPPWEDDE
ncbi:MAG: DNA translocase FtsK 4TM domain-containing protein [Lentisphaeria bacterium]|nr:DNA translocase FtsK 4TM domain-containing protein [Lentisphaeria bacterium]